MRALGLALILAAALIAVWVVGGGDDDEVLGVPPTPGDARNQVGYVFPEAPKVTNTGPLAPAVLDDLEALWETLPEDQIDRAAAERLGSAGDPRLAWLFADLLRFIQGGPLRETLVTSWSELTGVELEEDLVNFLRKG